ncbi:MAG: hypothetical protein NVS1B6_01170 [Steroidobacteraceae bacterium]
MRYIPLALAVCAFAQSNTPATCTVKGVVPPSGIGFTSLSCVPDTPNAPGPFASVKITTSAPGSSPSATMTAGVLVLTIPATSPLTLGLDTVTAWPDPQANLTVWYANLKGTPYGSVRVYLNGLAQLLNSDYVGSFDAPLLYRIKFLGKNPNSPIPLGPDPQITLLYIY